MLFWEVPAGFLSHLLVGMKCITFYENSMHFRGFNGDTKNGASCGTYRVPYIIYLRCFFERATICSASAMNIVCISLKLHFTSLRGIHL